MSNPTTFNLPADLIDRIAAKLMEMPAKEVFNELFEVRMAVMQQSLVQAPADKEAK